MCLAQPLAFGGCVKKYVRIKRTGVFICVLIIPQPGAFVKGGASTAAKIPDPIRDRGRSGQADLRQSANSLLYNSLRLSAMQSRMPSV